MAAPSGKYFGVGTLYGRILPLNALGAIDAPSTAPYAGIAALGINGLDFQLAEPRRIAHVGENRLMGTSILPAIEPSGASMDLGAIDFALHAALSNTKAFTTGDAKGVLFGTDKDGFEADVLALVAQKGKDALTKLTRYYTYLLPVVNGKFQPASMNDQAATYRMQMVINAANRFPWGLGMTAVDQGATEAQVIAYETDNPAWITVWKADGVATQFLFDVAYVPPATGKIHALTTWGTNGTITNVIGTATLAVDKVTIAGPLAAGTIVTCFHDYVL